MNEIKWEILCPSTSRLKVDGGHLYHVSISGEQECSTAMCFVPDVDLQRYQAHLRDAYKQGYEDGQKDCKHGINIIQN